MNRNLPKTVTSGKKRVGRGYGSGKGGHTSGRGQKGQKTRGKVNVLFEGIKTRKSFLKRTPQLRGKSKFHARPKPAIVSLESLEVLKEGTVINVENLIKAGLVDSSAKETGVKVLAKGKITKKFEFRIPVSGAAQKMIEKSGGKIIENA